MRALSEVQKDFFERLVNNKTQLELIHELSTHFKVEIAKILKSDEFWTITVLRTKNEEIVNEKIQELVSTLYLIEYFESLGLLIIYNDSENKSNTPEILAGLFKTEEDVEHTLVKIVDKKVVNLLNRYSYQMTFSTKEFDDIALKKFKSKADFNAERQWITTRRALFFSIGAFLLSTILNIVLWYWKDSNNSNEKHETNNKTKYQPLKESTNTKGNKCCGYQNN